MTVKSLLPLIAATIVCGGSVLVEARQPKSPVAVVKPKVSQPVQPQWKLYTAPDGRFTILMPGNPNRNTESQKTYMGEITLEIFIAQPPKQQVAYIVAYNDFPYSYGEMADPQAVLNNARDMALKTTKSNLISQRNIRSYNNHPGKEIQYINSGGKITISRMYVAEGRLYQVMAITTKKQQKTLAKTINGYLNSFNVVLKK
ncbi:MAG: hypothetical protein RMY64_20960 [Nostoc sp. DedQUE08]|uniref:hypothetical protein n=1 Tax=unclassified Nostoc TaxID=2593658 RepID=UPI002AD420C0|nr:MULTISPECIES: hypothetical protein [unclassified Nostoc]MDZ8034155.1 hypothetical protein [Nostoc sp. DedSLP04]MDZ8068066.1 hypothetical protein [Nostoc sp. DedQUE08]MDZ8097013.1 hypothetical protein [Nostoc sp. DedQUE05]MDZ8128996.1 hypothetical protein [Nostoc sp. DedQUE07]MDZ8139595.1 hypothetical protein [Nostoc sp. DedQUE04]